MVYRWKVNHRCEQPSMLAFFDTETLELPHATDQRVSCLHFRLGCLRIGAWDGSTFNAVETVYLSRPCQFWAKIDEHAKPRKPIWCFAHNVLFDLWVLEFPELVERGEFKLTVSDDTRTNLRRDSKRSHKGYLGQCSLDKGATIIKGIYRGKRVNFLDSYNYFRGSVESIGDSIGISKLQMPGSNASEKEWFDYCHRDVAVIEQAICGLMREWKLSDLGNWQPTIASLAFSAYRHRFMSRPPVCHGDADASQFERDSYYDGRTQPFYLGKVGCTGELFPDGASCLSGRNREVVHGPVYSVDINSLYPSVMRGLSYPVEAVADSSGRPIIWQPPSLEWLDEQLENYLCVANVQLQTDQDYYPVRTPNGTVYPVGRIWTTLCSPEYTLARSNGHIVSCSACILYHKHQIFDTWVDYWWERKHGAEQSGNQVRREVCKNLLNSLSGKFAQRERYWRNTNRFPAEQPWTSWVGIDSRTNAPVSLRAIGQTCQMLQDNGLAQHSLVAVSAHINSYARVRMMNDRLGLPMRSVLYCANDGLMLTQTGFDTLTSQGKVGTGNLGDYRLVGQYSTCQIHGPRDYECDRKITKAGLPKIRQQLDERKWRVKSFECANSLISRQPDGSVHLHESIMSGSEHCWGQRQDQSGWLRPIRLDQW